MEQRYMEILLEDIRSKFDLVLEGHAVLHTEIRATREELSAKIEQNSFEIKAMSQRLDSVAADLSAHRRDTERHNGYRVSE